MQALAFLNQLGPVEVLVIAGIALLIFGKRLPEVARSAGRAVVSFKEGLRETEKDIDKAGQASKDNDQKTS